MSDIRKRRPAEVPEIYATNYFSAGNYRDRIYAHARLGRDLQLLLTRKFDGWIYPVEVYPQVYSRPLAVNLLDPEIMLWNAFSGNKLRELPVRVIDADALLPP